jgi:hypothetical protein
MGTTYGIYSGQFDKDSMWLESVEGLGIAAKRMGELAAEKPGAYFVFCKRTQRVLVSIDTSKPDKREMKATA